MDNEKIYYSATTEEFLKVKSKYPDTLTGFLDEQVKRFGDKPAVGFFSQPTLSYREFSHRVEIISELLMEHGIQKGERVAILAENSPYWGIAYFSIIKTGAVAVPILPDFPEMDIRHILKDTETRVMFTTQKQLEKLSDLDKTRVKLAVMLDDFSSDEHDIHVESFSDILDKALEFIKKIPESMGLVNREVRADDVASIIYTSGTSGHSKAVMLTHKNFLSNVAAIGVLIDIDESDVFLSILPLSHVYEFTLGLLLPLMHGARVVYPGKPPTPRILEKVCKAEKPTLICSVPLILEKIYKKKVLPVLKKNFAAKMGTKLPGLKKVIYKKINRRLMEFFGGNLRAMAVGGASFNSEAEKFFKEAGFPYLVGYGLTESSPLLAGGPWLDKSIKWKSTGKPAPGCEIKIVGGDEKTGIGEIVARGPNVMKGYYKNPDMTAEVLDKEGWFKTGDLGYFDKHNNLYIMGRSKNMLLMANGENIYPEIIEEKLNACYFVLESLVMQTNSHLEAWVYLDYDLIDAETTGRSETQRFEYIEGILKELKEEVNRELPSFSRLAKVYEQEEPFVKTATHKIKRHLYTHG